MAKLPCISCEGCGDCCRGMGDTVHLDPYDIAMLCKNLNCTFEDLLDVRMKKTGAAAAFWAKTAAAGSTASVRDSAGSSPWDVNMTGRVFNTLSFRAAATCRAKRKSGSANGWIFLICPVTKALYPAGTILSGTPRPGLPAHRTRNSIKRSICFCCRPFTASPMILTGISMTSSRNVSPFPYIST